MKPAAPAKRAPTLNAIIAFKIHKGALFVAVAIAAYTLSDNNLPLEFQKVLHFLRVTPANKFFAHLAERVGHLTENDLLWTALGTIIYSSFSLVEGVGMIFRQGWAGWLAIVEAAFFIPIEVYELTRKGRFSWGLFVVLVLNILIVWYLFSNRHRLFKHH